VDVFVGQASLSVRQTHQKTQREVAGSMGLGDSTISEILAGKRKLSVKQIEAVVRFFKVNAAVFLNGW
jgi:transcriptional regulator with XRE-family HTH domain